MSLEMWLGIIGAVTGLFGTVLSIVAHEHSKKLVRANAWHDVEVAHDQVTRGAAALVDLLPHALKSRRNINAARGLFKSGAMEKFTAEHTVDTTAAAELRDAVKAIDAARFPHLSYDDLMEQLTVLRKLRGGLEDLMKKYEASLAEDRNNVEQLRADKRAVGPPSRESGYRRE
jgi:hypothetical protein